MSKKESKITAYRPQVVESSIRCHQSIRTLRHASNFDRTVDPLWSDSTGIWWPSQWPCHLHSIYQNRVWWMRRPLGQRMCNWHQVRMERFRHCSKICGYRNSTISVKSDFFFEWAAFSRTWWQMWSEDHVLRTKMNVTRTERRTMEMLTVVVSPYLCASKNDEISFEFRNQNCWFFRTNLVQSRHNRFRNKKNFRNQQNLWPVGKCVVGCYRHIVYWWYGCELAQIQRKKPVILNHLHQARKMHLRSNKLTWTFECDHFAAYRLHFWYFGSFFNILHANRCLQLQEVISQNVFSELAHTERIEAPIDWMPSLKCTVHGYQNGVSFFCVLEGKRGGNIRIGIVSI